MSITLVLHYLLLQGTGTRIQHIAESLVQLRVVHNLMYAMGNADYADSQRQAAISLGVSHDRKIFYCTPSH